MDESLLLKTDTFEISQIDFFIRMLIATGIGFIIGLEREHSHPNEKVGEVFAGVRTFIMVVILGFVTTLLSFVFSYGILLTGFIGVFVFVVISYVIGSQKGETGGTTEFAIILAFLLGVITFLGYIESSIGLTILVMLVLSMKVKVRSLIGSISQEELFAFIKFSIIALLALSFLPDKTYGPNEVINPREIGWIIVLTSGIGYAGYMLMKFLGSRQGILLTGLIGGFVSSTVVTWLFSKKSKETPELSASCSVAILAASGIMVVRVVIWVLIINRSLLPPLLIPMILLFATAIFFAFRIYKKEVKNQQRIHTDVPLGNPLNIKEAIFFGLIYTVILLLVSYANEYLGTSGLYLSSAVAGLTDVDAITISVSKMGIDKIPSLVAQNAIIIASLCNTFVKIGIALVVGSTSMRRYILIGYSAILVAGLIGLLILNF